MVVVQLERADTGGVGLKTQHHHITHQPHVFIDVLRNSFGGARSIGFFQRGAPSLQGAPEPGVLDTSFHLAHRMQVFVEFLLVESADLPTQSLGFLPYGIEHTLVSFGCRILEQAIKSQGRVKLQGSG